LIFPSCKLVSNGCHGAGAGIWAAAAFELATSPLAPCAPSVARDLAVFASTRAISPVVVTKDRDGIVIKEKLRYATTNKTLIASAANSIRAREIGFMVLPPSIPSRSL
jgi:hypothetical protein